MEIPTALLLGGLVAGFALSLVAFARALLGAGVARMRIDLWQVHDQIVDGLVAETYTRPDQALEALMTTRGFIFHAREFSFLRVFGGYAIIKASGGIDLYKSANKRSIFEGRPVDDLLAAQVEKLSMIMALSVFRTSLIGRAGMVALPIVWVVWRLVSRRGVKSVPHAERLAVRPLRTELKRELILSAVTGNQDRELASAAC